MLFIYLLRKISYSFILFHRTLNHESWTKQKKNPKYNYSPNECKCNYINGCRNSSHVWIRQQSECEWFFFSSNISGCHIFILEHAHIMNNFKWKGQNPCEEKKLAEFKHIASRKKRSSGCFDILSNWKAIMCEWDFFCWCAYLEITNLPLTMNNQD